MDQGLSRAQVSAQKTGANLGHSGCPLRVGAALLLQFCVPPYGDHFSIPSLAL
jgi:hypothetical protein